MRKREYKISPSWISCYIVKYGIKRKRDHFCGIWEKLKWDGKWESSFLGGKEGQNKVEKRLERRDGSRQKKRERERKTLELGPQFFTWFAKSTKHIMKSSYVPWSIFVMLLPSTYCTSTLWTMDSTPTSDHFTSGEILINRSQTFNWLLHERIAGKQ